MFKAKFYISKDLITRVTLSPSSGEPSWEILGPDLPLINDWMECYCQGKQPRQKLPMADTNLPPYTRKVLNILSTTRFGQVVTYQELATLTHNPHAARAVGNACARNPFPLIIPCHRVLSSRGLGGYAFGLSLKKALLEFEANLA